MLKQLLGHKVRQNFVRKYLKICQVLSLNDNVLTYARGKMPGNFADIEGTTARTQKLVYHTHTEPTRDRILHTKLVADFK